MAHPSNETLRCALFIDFDNIYTCLKKHNAAEAFASQPQKWLDWLIKRLTKEDTFTRRIGVRRCYLSPHFSEHRSAFTGDGFEVIDCHRLTSTSKNSADIRMTVDILTMLDHKVRYDEFILFSADSDFAPVLSKLREHDRSTVILPVGEAASAYRAVSDIVLCQNEFVCNGLGIVKIEEKPASPPPIVTPKARAIAATKSEPHTVTAIKTDEAAIKEVTSFILSTVRNAPTPSVSLGQLSTEIRNAGLNPQKKWWGHKSLKSLLKQLKLEDVKLIESGTGSLAKPKQAGKQQTNTASKTATKPPSKQDFIPLPLLPHIIQRVHKATGIPALRSEQYTQIFCVITEVINQNGYDMNDVSKKVRDICQERKLPMNRKVSSYMLNCIRFGGYEFGQQETPDMLAGRFLNNTLNLCEKAELALSESERKSLAEWILGRDL